MRIVLCLLIASSLFAQTPPQPAATTADLCKLAGRVTNIVTNEPIRKGKVTLRPGDPVKPVYTASTDNDGKFLIENIDPGRYTATAERQGFVNQNYGASRPPGPGATIDLKADKSVADIVIKMTPQGVIAGRVLDDEGEPMSGLTVMALHYQYMSGRKHLIPAGMPVQSNDLGEYRVANLPPDRYYVSSSAQKIMSIQTGTERPASKGPEEGYVPVYFPNAPDVSSASPVTVAPGAEVRGIDLRLRKMHVVRVSGKVNNALTGEPMKSGVLMVYRRETGGMSVMPSSMYVVQGGKGTFELRDIPPGAYTLLAMSTSDPQNMMLSMSNLDVGDQEVRELVINVGAGADIPVVAKLANGVPAADNSAGAGKPDAKNASTDISNLKVTLQMDDNPLAAFATAQLGKDYTGVLKHVNPEKYKLIVSGLPPDVYLKSARLGEQDVLESGLDVRQGVSGSLELVIGAPASELTGVVRNEKGEAAPGAIVTLVPKNAKHRTDLSRTGTADQNGSYRIRGIVPAEYNVFAWEDIEAGAADDEAVRKPFDKNKAEVTLTEGASSSLPLTMISRAALEESKSKGQ